MDRQIFSGKNYLDSLIAGVHEGKKSFHCLFCDAKFLHKGNLNKHVISTHENPKSQLNKKKKPFSCTICDGKFGEKRHLNHHIELVHEQKKLFKCTICDANFTTKTGLNRHKNLQHLQPIVINF